MSYLLNAVTSGKNSKKLDMALFDELNPGAVSVFLKELLDTGKSKLILDVDDYKADLALYEKAHKLIQLFSMQNKYRDGEIKDFGIDSQHIGFPLVSRVAKGVKGKVILAPLVVWKAHVEVAPDRSRVTLSVDGSAGVRLNEALHSFQATLGEMEPLFNDTDSLIEDSKVLDQVTLTTYLNQIKKRISYFNPDHSDDLVPEEGKVLTKVPKRKADIEKIEEEIPAEYRFYFSGVIGLFKSTKEAIIKDLQAYQDRMGKQSLGQEEMELDRVSSFDLDPSQLTTYNIADSKKNLVIHGPPGTGKSTVLSGLIASALKEGKKILFVCEKITALDIIKEKLSEKGVDKEVVLITDLVGDKKEVLSQARSLLESEPENHVFNEKIARSEYDRYKAKHKDHIEGLNHQYLFDWGFKKTCGRRISLKRRGVTCPDFSNDFLKAFESAGEISLYYLRQAEETFTDINLGHDYFTVFGITTERNAGIIESSWPGVSDQLGSVFQNYCDSKESFVHKTQKYLESEIGQCEERAKEVDFHANVLKSCQKELELFFKEDSTVKSLKVLFSKKYKKARETLEALFEMAADQSNDLRHDINLPFSLKHFLEEKIKNYRQQLVKLNGEKGQLELIELYFPNEFRSLKDLGRRWSAIFEEHELNHQYNLLSEDSTVYVVAAQAVVENINLINSYNDFLHFLDRIQVVDYQSDIELFLPGEGWADQVELALLNETLTKSSILPYSKLHTNDRSLGILSERYHELVKNDARSLKYVLQSNRESFVSEFAAVSNVSVNQLFTVNRRASRNNLLNLFSEYRDLMVHIFPLVLTTPGTSSALFRGVEKYFDLVIFDEASQLTVEDSFGSLLKAKKIIISGDEHQMPPSKYFVGEAQDGEEYELDEEEYWELQQLLSESLLKFGIHDNRNFSSTHLDFHYRSFHHKLIDFSNAAFYKRLIPIPQKHDYKPIDFVQVNGIFEDGQNIEEAHKVIEVLESLSEDFLEHNTVGVATLNAKQQKLIWNLMDEKAEENESFRALKSKLEAKDFFVKNLENLQGDERDLMILSVGYGPGRSKFIRNFGMLHRAIGHRLLNVLITRARKRMVVLNSIPPKEYLAYNELRATKGNTGSAIFYAYLAYARAVSDENSTEVADILSNLRAGKTSQSDKSEELESPFEEAVYEMLRGEFTEEEIKIAEPDSGFRIDMVIRPVGHPGLKIAVECDGAAYHSGYANHFADIHRQRILEGSGYRFVRIWGKSWYLNAEVEFKELMKKIRGVISTYESEDILPAYARLFDLKSLELKRDVSGIEVVEEKEEELLAHKHLEQSEDLLKVTQNYNSVKPGMSVELQLLNKSGGRQSYTIAEKGDIKKKKLGINAPLVAAIRNHKIGTEFDFNEYRYKLLSLN